jgi:hypothetical protein
VSERANRNGTAYALTVFTAIIPGHEDETRTIIESLPRGAYSPLARLKQLHTSRLQIFDRLVYQGAPQKVETLKNNYLVFTAAFDGDPDPFLDAIAEVLPHEADSWWRHCVAYPGMADRTAFKRWIRHNQIDTSMFAVASPNRTVADVVESLALRERVLAFAIEAQGLGAAELQERFQREFGSVAR